MMVRSRRSKKRGAVRGATGANKVLPLNQSIPLGIQHVLAMFAGNITVPIIIAGIFGQTTEEKIFLIQMALFVAGVATIIQTVGYRNIGSRLPTIQGTSFAFIPVMAPYCKSWVRSSFYRSFYWRTFPNVDWQDVKTYSTYVSTISYGNCGFNDWYKSS